MDGIKIISATKCNKFCLQTLCFLFVYGQLVFAEPPAKTLPSKHNMPDALLQEVTRIEAEDAIPSLAAINMREARIKKVVDSLEYPWAFEFLPDGQLLVTEFAGRIKKVDPASGKSQQIKGLPDIATGFGQMGLFDIAIHPQFDKNGLIYFSCAVRAPHNKYITTTALYRARLEGVQLTELKQLVLAMPFAKTKANYGGAIEFDDKGYLYFAIGDRGKKLRSQRLFQYNGKVLRLNDDGSVPDDNPFFGQQKVLPEIYTYGNRNPQGLVFDHASGLLFETEHGPMGGDEVNVLQAGRNYGSPVISYGQTYDGRKIGEGTYKKGMEQPLFYYLPSIATSPIEVYRGKMFPEWDGDLLVGALRGQHISKLDVVDNSVISEYPVLSELNQRIRDIKVAGDGSIWILCEGGMIYRLYRKVESLTQ